MSRGESDQAVRISRYFLRPIGLWPVPKEASQAYRFFNALLVVASYWLIMFILVPCALHTFLEEPNIAIKMKLIGPMSFAVMAVAKYGSLTQRTAEIADCFEHVEEDWRNSCMVEKKVRKVMSGGLSLTRLSLKP